MTHFLKRSVRSFCTCVEGSLLLELPEGFHLSTELPELLVDDVLRVGLDQILPPPSKANLTKRQTEAVEALEAAGHDFTKIFGPSEEHVHFAEAPVEPASEPTQPTGTPAEPVSEPQPTGTPAEPVSEPTQPTELPTGTDAGTDAGSGWVKRVDPDTGVTFFAKG